MGLHESGPSLSGRQQFDFNVIIRLRGLAVIVLVQPCLHSQILLKIVTW